jgi:4-hydroxythreonine-4-phosphate dehydrogenase
MSETPVVGVTMGDPASIGPEIVAKALASPDVHETARPVVIGAAGPLQKAIAVLGLGLSIRKVTHPEEARFELGTIDLIEVPGLGLEGVEWGKIQARAGRAAFEFIRTSIDLALLGHLDAVATAPVNKEAFRAAGVKQIGHTEIFGELTGSPDPLTMFETRSLRIFFLTRHLSLLDAVRRVTLVRTYEAILRSAEALTRLGIEAPRIAVAALNPHGGEHGLFGDEEERELLPAIERARASGHDARGPYPADSVFWQAANGQFDAVLSLFHDQGHIAAKMFDFERTVSITNGLPFLRTSVDHGTAFDIAGKGIASPVSMIEAIRAAGRYAPAFRQTRGALTIPA